MRSVPFILLWGIPVLIGFAILSVIHNPLWFVTAIMGDRIDRKLKRDLVEAELDRKTAIADAAIAARARGESYTPPADYDR